MTTTTTSTNLLVNNSTYLNTTKSSVFFSSKLLNYIEPIEIAGFRKTAFYSEISTNFNVGDRVFILNGNYDSDEFISKDKYAKYTDGYRVLGVDGCRIILDLDWSGILPYEESNSDGFINIHHIRSQREFDYVNSIKIGLRAYTPYYPYDGIYSKFFGGINGNTASFYTNSIIFSDNLWLGSQEPDNINGGLFNGGFFVRNDISIPPNFVNITSYLINNNIESIGNQYNGSIDRIYIVGEDITWDGKTYKQRNAYKFLNGEWVVDIKYKQPMISKLNFRYGKFKGKHNDGIFGTNIKTNIWDSGTWISGIFLNSVWNGGIMGTKISNEIFYVSTFLGTQSAPTQNVDASNNKGFGYNYILDSNFYKGELRNGNFDNCNLGLSSSFSAVDIFYGLTHTSDLIVGGGKFNLCDIDSVNFSRSLFVNSTVRNSNLLDSKFVNSQVINSAANKSEFSASSGIKILAADLWSYKTSTDNPRGILKLYISNADLYKLNFSDSFYISKLNKDYFLSSLNEDQKVLLPLETKYILDYYYHYEITSTNLSKISVSIKNRKDNKYKTKIVSGSNTLADNEYNFDSIDIQLDNFYEDLNNVFLSPLTTENVNNIFQNTYLQNADFKSGVFENSIWSSGDNINNYHNIVNRRSGSGSQNISYSDGLLRLELPTSTSQKSLLKMEGEDISIGDNIWLNSIYCNYGSTSTLLDGRYKVTNIESIGNIFVDRFYLTPLDSNVLSSLSNIPLVVGITYSNNGALGNNYSSISNFLINKSTIVGGLFRRSNIQNSTIDNKLFNNNDRALSISNINQLRLTNILFNTNNNTINSGLVYKSHFVNGKFNNGVIFNSVWNGGTFNGGIFKNGYWINGTFNNGSFIESRGITTSIPGQYPVEISRQYYYKYDNQPKYRNWSNGTFSLGEFYDSVWTNGTFNNGRFYNSDWYGGIWNNGVLGSDKIPATNTNMSFKSPLPVGATFTIWNNGIVENAIVGGSGSVYWYGGKFNNGEFTSYGQRVNNQSIWYDGDFNGGKFTELARWKNGNFNKGKFLSYYGWRNVSPLNPSTYSSDYGWENGKFNGGVFGNGETGTNSIWFNGEFNDGTFIGRFWNYGIFTKGSFIGSGSSSVSNDYVQSFSQSYYGLWYDGFVSDRKNLIQTDKRISTELVRKIEEKPILNDVSIKNILWMGGTFSHNLGKIYDSVWLDGTFAKGSLITTQFNPYVDKTFSGATSYSFNFNDTCVWEGGDFYNGNFYVSEWKNGIFHGGAMNGGIWRDGTWNYGNANNIYWETGLWRNGIWNGSPFVATQSGGTRELIGTSSYQVVPGYEHDLMINVAQASGTNSLHLINAFGTTYSSEYLSDPGADNGVGTILDILKSFYYKNTGTDLNWDTESYYYTYRDTGYQSQQIGTTNSNIWVAGNSNSELLYLTVDAAKFVSGIGATTSVLQRLTTYPDSDIYEIKIDVCVEWTNFSYSSPIGTANIRVYWPGGNLGTGVNKYSEQAISTAKTVIGGTTTYSPGFYTFNLSIKESELGSNREVKIQSRPPQIQIDGATIPKVRILGASINARVSTYSAHNNTLYPSMPSNPTFSSAISVPNDLSLIVISNRYPVPLTFGNGLFKSGIWENGVWNNGWRGDDLTRPFVLTSAIPMSNGNTWNITLNALGSPSFIGQTLQSFQIGDKVSIGNIISIDKNNSRSLLKNYYRIISKDYITTDTNSLLSSITCQVIVNFPIRSIEIDSTSHINYVTKNVWLSGVFLNGYFSGVWNNGLVKGRPYLTLLENTQWIDGEFSGGHFKGLTDSIKYTTNNAIETIGTDRLGSQNISIYINSIFSIDDNNMIRYNKSLIQNFNFNDEYTIGSGTGSKARFDSWIDLNYSTQSQTNLNKESVTYQLGFTSSSEYFKNEYNLFGSPTYDILSSYSKLTDYDSTNQQTYKLGSKYITDYNFIPDDGNFNKPISTQIPFVGPDNFVIDGWELIDYSSNIGYPIEYSSNVDPITSRKLRFTGATYSYGIVNNSFVKELVERNRYYVMSADLDTNDSTHIFFSPAVNFDHSKTISNKKIEYFYNKQDLEFFIVGQQLSGSFSFYSQNNLDLRIKNISFYETDMVPFFKFANVSNINTDVRPPYYVASIPEIDYSNSNYDFVDNIDIVITTKQVENQYGNT